MKNIISILVAIVAVALAAPGFAEYLPGQTEQRDVVPSQDLLVEFLSGEGYVQSRLELRKVSNDVVSDLATIADDAAMPTTVRERAIDCLALYRSNADARKTISGMLENYPQNSPLFDNVLMSAAQIGGERAVSQLREFADAKNKAIRATVVVALGRFGGQSGFELLKKRAEVEQDEQVQSYISRYVN